MSERSRLRSVSSRSSMRLISVVSRLMPKLALIFPWRFLGGGVDVSGPVALPHLRLHQIILRTLMDRLHGEPFVVQSAHDDDGELRSGGVGALEGVRHRAVRERKVQQHQIDASSGKAFQSLGERANMLQI